MRRIILTILLMILIFFAPNSSLKTEKAEFFKSQTAVIAQLENYGSSFYRNTLTDPKEKKLYDDIKTALFYRIDDYRFHADTETINKITVYVCLDNPFFTLTNGYYTIEGSNEPISLFNYNQLHFIFDDKDYYRKMLSAFQAASNILSTMPDYTNEYDKVKYLHDYMVTHVRYTYDYTDKDADNAYGALINGKARCEGYANAFSILLNLASIDNMKAFYFGEDANTELGHIWNIVRVNNEYYHVDITNDSFDDTADVPDDYVNYTYFLISTADIKKTSPINPLIADIIPSCDSEIDNFFQTNDLYFSDYNRQKVGKAAGQYLAEQKKQGIKGVSIKFNNAADYKKALSSSEIGYLLSIIADYDSYNSSYFNYYANEIQKVITFFPLTSQ